MASEIPDTSALNSDTIQEIWHPKLTPYRFLVLSTTIGLGTAKAITAESGRTAASITLEWISGVVVLLILQCVSSYDCPESAAPYPISWMFTADCMDFIWNIFRVYSLPRPKYHSDEVLYRDNNRTSDRPAITLYRLLMCTTVVCFGVTKAALAYAGYSTAASGIDWTFGVLVTAILYCVGLYENNSARKWEGFFLVDYSGPVKSAGRVFLDVVIALISGAWITFWMFLLREIVWIDWYDPGAAPSRFINQVQITSFKVMLTTLSLYAIAFGVFILLVFLRRIAKRSRLGVRLLSAVSIAVLSFFTRQKISAHTGNTARRVFIHVAVHLSGVFFCIATALFYLGFAFPELQDKSVAEYLVWTFIAIVSALMAAVATMWGWKLIRRMLGPWYLYHSPRRPEWEGSLLSLGLL